MSFVRERIRFLCDTLRARMGVFLHDRMPTPEEIADKTGVDIETAKSWHREILRAREEFNCGKL